jgi:hypothetical protein
VTTDPGPGSQGFPLPPSSTPPPGGPPAAYGPPTYGHPVPFGPSPYHQQVNTPGRFAQPGMLAAAADRERTMDVLKAAFMEGRLTKTEFDERSSRVLSARTYGELNNLVADLPSGPGGPAAMPVPYAGAYYSPQLAPPTNGMAIGALICAFVPFFGSILAVALGHAARGKIRQTGERGDGMAIAGLVLGYLGLSFWALIIIASIANGG